jgi:16S rRNA methyltransferase RsmB/F
MADHLHLHSLAEWDVQLSTEIQQHLTTAEGLPSFPVDYIARWLSSSIKVSPSMTVCRFNHCSFDNPLGNGTRNVGGKIEAIQKLQCTLQKWLVERGHGSNYDVLVTAHGILDDVICIQILRPCEPHDADFPHHYSLYHSKRPPPLDTWYHRHNSRNLPSLRETDVQLTHCPNGSSIASSSRKGRPYESQHAWRKGLWPPYPYGVVIVDRRCGEAVLRGADIYPTSGILCTDTFIAPQSPVAVYVDMTSYRDTNINRGPVDPKCTRGRRRRRKAHASTRISRGISLQDCTSCDDDKNIVFIGIGMAKCSRTAMFSKSPLRDAAIEMVQIALPLLVTTGSAGAAYLLPSMNEVLLPLHDSIVVQNLPSIVVAHALLEDDVPSDRLMRQNGVAAEPGEWILDMCCAPGGKTSHVASLCRQRGRNARDGPVTIVACDKSRKKILQVREFLQRLGCLADQLVVPLVLDTTQCVLHMKDDDESTLTQVRRTLHAICF